MFWDASGVAPRPSRKLSAVGLFQTHSRQAHSLAQDAEDGCAPRLPQERPLLTLRRRSLSQKGWLTLQAGAGAGAQGCVFWAGGRQDRRGLLPGAGR